MPRDEDRQAAQRSARGSAKIASAKDAREKWQRRREPDEQAEKIIRRRQQRTDDAHESQNEIKLPTAGRHRPLHLLQSILKAWLRQFENLFGEGMYGASPRLTLIAPCTFEIHFRFH